MWFRLILGNQKYWSIQLSDDELIIWDQRENKVSMKKILEKYQSFIF